MVKNVWDNSPRIDIKRVLTQASNTEQWSICSIEMLLKENALEYQLFPPHHHRHNTVERAIRTSKEHFVAEMASEDPDLPLHLSDHLFSNAEITLNLLRTSRQHPQLSAAHSHGMINYNKTAFAPPGCNIITHEKPTQ
jgi:hypothetical protein